MPTTLTPSDRSRLASRGPALLGLAALAEVRRELRRPVRDRDDAWLIACAQGCNIEVDEQPRRTDATCYTRHAGFSTDGIQIDWSRCEGMASDRSIRSAIRRLLESQGAIVHYCACAPCPTWHPRAD